MRLFLILIGRGRHIATRARARTTFTSPSFRFVIRYIVEDFYARQRSCIRGHKKVMLEIECQTSEECKLARLPAEGSDRQQYLSLRSKNLDIVEFVVGNINMSVRVDCYAFGPGNFPGVLPCSPNPPWKSPSECLRKPQPGS